MTTAAQPARIRLTLYGRRYCHLCEEMAAGLQPLRATQGFEVDVVDVDTDDALVRRYGELVPVLAHNDKVICHYHLDRSALTAYLGGFR